MCVHQFMYSVFIIDTICSPKHIYHMILLIYPDFLQINLPDPPTHLSDHLFVYHLSDYDYDLPIYLYLYLSVCLSV